MTGPHLPIEVYARNIFVQNKFDTLQESFERHTLSNESENFVTARIKAAAVCIPTKPRAKMLSSIWIISS